METTIKYEHHTGVFRICDKNGYEVQTKNYWAAVKKLQDLVCEKKGRTDESS